jgi:MoxR-like ATPase
VSDEILNYVVELGDYLRKDSRISLGPSPRAMVQLVHCARANAFLENRNFVIPDDIKLVAPHVLAHRIKIERTAMLKGLADTPGSVITSLLSTVRPPR